MGRKKLMDYIDRKKVSKKSSNRCWGSGKPVRENGKCQKIGCGKYPTLNVNGTARKHKGDPTPNPDLTKAETPKLTEVPKFIINSGGKFKIHPRAQIKEGVLVVVTGETFKGKMGKVKRTFKGAGDLIPPHATVDTPRFGELTFDIEELCVISKVKETNGKVGKKS